MLHMTKSIDEKTYKKYKSTIDLDTANNVHDALEIKNLNLM